MADIGDVVRVSASISSAGVLRRNLGRTLFLTRDSSVLDATGSGRVRAYASEVEVANDFGAGTAPRQAAAVYFAQNPFPRNFLVARFTTRNVNDRLLGGRVSNSVTQINQNTNNPNLSGNIPGSFMIGTNRFNVDFSTLTLDSYAAIGTALGTAVDGTYSGASGSYNEVEDRFELDFGPSTATSTGAFTAPTRIGNDMITGDSVTSVTDATALSSAPFSWGASDTIAAFQIAGEDVAVTGLSNSTTIAELVAAINSALAARSDNLRYATVSFAQDTTTPANGVFSVDYGRPYFAPSGFDLTGGGVWGNHSTLPANGQQVASDMGLDAGFSLGARDISALLAMRTADGATVAMRHSFGGADDALDEIDTFDNSWYNIVLDDDLNNTEALIDVIRWSMGRGNARPSFVWGRSNDPLLLDATNTSNIAYRASQLQSDRFAGIYSQSAYAPASYAARFSSVNFREPASQITGKFLRLPGILPDQLSRGQIDRLNNLRWNYYTSFAGDNRTAEGVTTNPDYWMDVRIWIDGFVDAVRTDCYNHLIASRRIPQTDAGSASIKEVIERVCQEGVRNGGLAAGFVSPATRSDIQVVTGNTRFDGRLTLGYLVYVASFATQSQSNRNARLSPPFRVWLKGAGAIHFMDIAVNFEN